MRSLLIAVAALAVVACQAPVDTGPTDQMHMIEARAEQPPVVRDEPPESAYTGAWRDMSTKEIQNDVIRLAKLCKVEDSHECVVAANAQTALMDRGICLAPTKKIAFVPCPDDGFDHEH